MAIVMLKKKQKSYLYVDVCVGIISLGHGYAWLFFVSEDIDTLSNYAGLELQSVTTRQKHLISMKKIPISSVFPKTLFC
jgi:hypothetical protein